MWTTVALMAVLSLAPEQAGQLNLANVRTAYGAPGVLRTDTKLLPGDQLTVAFDIEGVTVSPEGKVLYSMATELLDGKGKPVFKAGTERSRRSSPPWAERASPPSSSWMWVWINRPATTPSRSRLPTGPARRPGP